MEQLNITDIGKDFDAITVMSLADGYWNMYPESLSEYNSTMEDESQRDTIITKNFPELRLTNSLPSGYIILPNAVMAYYSTFGIGWGIYEIDGDYLYQIAEIRLDLDISSYQPEICWLDVDGGGGAPV